MTTWKDMEQEEWKLPDGTIWIGKAEEPIRTGSLFYYGKNGRGWKILDIDSEKNRMLVLAVEPVAQKPYHDEKKHCTWETCSLRKWLNTEFLENEFCEEERTAILQSIVKAESNPTTYGVNGNDTCDRIFLLGGIECKNYSKYGYNPRDLYEEGMTYWLRNAGRDNRTAAIINEYTYIYEYGTDVTKNYGVCPVMWIDMNAEPVRSSIVINENNEHCFVNPKLVIKNGELIHGSVMCTNEVLPAYVNKIRKKAFRSCHELQSITWENKDLYADANAFVDCPKLHLPVYFYQRQGQRDEGFAEYMPYDSGLMTDILMSPHGFGEYWKVFLKYISEDNAADIAGELLKRIQEKKRAYHYEGILRFALAASPIIGKAGLKTIQKYLRSVNFLKFTWEPVIQREMEQTRPQDLFAKAILNNLVVPDEMISTMWPEYDRLPSFAEIMYAAGEYAQQYKNTQLMRSEYGYKALAYTKNAKAEELGRGMVHSTFTNLLWKWEDKYDRRWYAPFAAYANDAELLLLIYGTSIDEKLSGAILLNDTVTAMRYADEKGFLGHYAKIRGLDEDDLRDNSISDFGLDENGKRTWTLGGKTMTAAADKELTVSLTDEEGTLYNDMPELGTDLAEAIRVQMEYRDLKDNVRPTAKRINNKLFADFLSGREREAGSWKKTYLHKVIFKILAKLVVWQQEDHTFTLDDNGQAVTVEGIAYTITDAPIKVAHPMEMQEDAVEAWQRYFADRHLKQPFEQVWEPVKEADTVTPDRYAGCWIKSALLEDQEPHGIYVEGFGLELKGCRIVSNRELAVYNIQEYRYDAWTRQVNHITAILDKYAVSQRIREDDMRTMGMLNGSTLAQITEFIQIANEAQAHTVLAQLIEYKKTHFGDMDPMTEFTLDL